MCIRDRLRGIPVAAIVGAVGGDKAARLNVLHAVNETQLAKVRMLLACNICSVELLDTSEKLLIQIVMQGGGHTAFAEIKGAHTHVTALQKDGVPQPLPCADEKSGPDEEQELDYDSLTLKGILEYAQRAELGPLAPILDVYKRQVMAIAIHNIPEGIAVSVPIYQATGSKAKAFRYSFLSGLAEPVGALLGWLVLMPIMNDTVYGVIFAAVAGIMVFISLDELLPAAWEYGEHHLSIYGLISGMAVMAVSLLLFL